MASLLSLLALLSPAALAFSGSYVGGPGDRPQNRESQAVMARSGEATTLTLFNDVQAGQRVFGLVVPVPVAIDAGNVRVIEPDLLRGIEQYSGPRTTELTCVDLYFTPADDPSSGCSSGRRPGTDTAWFDDSTDGVSVEDEVTGVTVEDRFTVGEYEAFVLQGEDAEGLQAWLSQEGLALPEGAEDVLQETINKGHYFLALRAELAEVPAEQTWLTPIQIGFSSTSWTLPLRLGTFSSGGLQDLVLFLLTDAEMGEIGIENFGPPAEIPSECLLSSPQDAGPVYQRLLAQTLGLPERPEDLGGATGLAWAVEHQWENGECEPCTQPGRLTGAEVEALGLPDGRDPYVFTRLRLRYTPGAMPEDPRFVATGQPVEPIQKRYYVGSWEIAGELPSCEPEPIADVGPCYSASWMAYREHLDIYEQPTLAIEEPDGCNHKRALLLLVLPPAFGLLRRRRRA